MYDVYTDGACSGNPGVGGWGVYWRHGDVEFELSGGEPTTTNNRMEMRAVIEALKRLPLHDGSVSVCISTDSKYVFHGITGWIHDWKQRDWKKKNSKQIILNKDMWMEMDHIVSSSVARLDFRWIKGHNGHEENERADRLARQGCLTEQAGAGA